LIREKIPWILKALQIAMASEECHVEHEHIADTIDNEGLWGISKAESVYYDGTDTVLEKKALV